MKRANNFGLNIQTIHGPRTVADLNESDKRGHTLVTIEINKILSKGSMDLLIAAKALQAQAVGEGLEFEDSYGTWRFLSPLNDAELAAILEKKQKKWQDGLEQYLWIAADVSNAAKVEDRYKAKGTKADDFQTISKGLGFDVTPFWEFEYVVLEGYEKIDESMAIEVLNGKVLGS